MTMIEIVEERHGVCATCGKWPDESRIWRVEFGHLSGSTSVCLCEECMNLLEQKLRMEVENDKMGDL